MEKHLRVLTKDLFSLQNFHVHCAPYSTEYRAEWSEPTPQNCLSTITHWTFTIFWELITTTNKGGQLWSTCFLYNLFDVFSSKTAVVTIRRAASVSLSFFFFLEPFYWLSQQRSRRGCHWDRSRKQYRSTFKGPLQLHQQPKDCQGKCGHISQWHWQPSDNSHRKGRGTQSSSPCSHFSAKVLPSSLPVPSSRSRICGNAARSAVREDKIDKHLSPCLTSVRTLTWSPTGTFYLDLRERHGLSSEW